MFRDHSVNILSRYIVSCDYQRCWSWLWMGHVFRKRRSHKSSSRPFLARRVIIPQKTAWRTTSILTVRSTLMIKHLLSRCNGRLGTCPGTVEDKINITTGTPQIMDQSFQSVASYQHFTDKLYLRIAGFSVSCGQLTLKWFVLTASSACNTVSAVKGTFANSNAQQTLTGKEKHSWWGLLDRNKRVPELLSTSYAWVSCTRKLAYFACRQCS